MSNITYSANQGDAKTNYLLKAHDGTQFLVAPKVLTQSVVLTNAIARQNSKDTPIQVPDVNSPILDKILEWCFRHRDDAPYAVKKKNKRPLVLPKWDKEYFANMTNQQLFDVLTAVTYLKIPKFMDYLCKVIGDIAAKRTTEELRKLFDGNVGEAAIDQPGPSNA